MKQILSCQQSKYDRSISLKAVIANVPCYYQPEIQWENSIDLREGISQIVKCVGVETPHCGNVEMWWIHIVKMWRCGGSTFLVWRSTLISNSSKNKRKSPLCWPTIYLHLFTFKMWKSTLLHNTSTLLHITLTFKMWRCGGSILHQILRVKVHIASTSQEIWILSSTSNN